MGTMLNYRMMASLAGATLIATAVANVQQSPYGIIAARNPFGLKPIPIPEEKVPEVPPAPPLPEVKITGITTLLSTALVTLQYEDKETKKVEFPPLLSEGGKFKNLVVERIDVENQRVVIRNGDALATLDFVHNGVKPSTGPAMVASTPPPNSPTFTAGAPGSPNVFIGNAPNSKPPLTPEQERMKAEILRRNQMMQGQGGTGLSAPPPFPSNRGLVIPNGAPNPR